jgi:hypothetical protein
LTGVHLSSATRSMTRSDVLIEGHKRQILKRKGIGKIEGGLLGKIFKKAEKNSQPVEIIANSSSGMQP